MNHTKICPRCFCKNHAWFSDTCKTLPRYMIWVLHIWIWIMHDLASSHHISCMILLYFVMNNAWSCLIMYHKIIRNHTWSCIIVSWMIFHHHVMIHALSYRKSGMSLSRFKHDPEIYHAGLILAIIKCNLCKLTSESITNDKNSRQLLQGNRQRQYNNNKQQTNKAADLDSSTCWVNTCSQLIIKV